MKAIDREYEICVEDRKRRPDIRMEAEVDGTPCLVLVESKISALEQPGQLSDYKMWLKGQEANLKFLVTLTRDSIHWSERPHGELKWADLREEVLGMKDRAISQNLLFESSYWSQLLVYLEQIMQTFEGFTSTFPDVHGLMIEVDLFLASLLRAMNIERVKTYWGQDRASYYLPDFRVTVGFYWWKGNEWRQRGTGRENVLVIWKDGEKDWIPIMTLEQIIKESNQAAKDGKLADYVARVAQRLREVSGLGEQML